MKNEYIITEQELAERGLILNDYALGDEYIPAIIHLGLDICVSRCCYMNDSFNNETDIEKDLDLHNEKIGAFKKLQYRVIYNLIFQAETTPNDALVDTIISHELGWGKINGFQKGIFHRVD